MAFCTSCGHDLGDGTFCTNCGSPATESTPLIPEVGSFTENEEFIEPSSDSTSTDLNSKKKPLILWLSISAVAILFITAIATARHWEKIDVPAHAETFHSETYLTGDYDIVDNNVSPCYIRQSWVGCTNVYVAIYNATCAAYPLTSSGSNYCNMYLAMINDMKSQSWSYLASIPSNPWGSLSVIAEEATRSVSNNDYRPAQTHEAVCYLGFLGECK